MAAPPTDLAAADIVTLVGSGRSMGEQRKAEQAETESGRFYRDVHGIDEVDLDAPDSVVVDIGLRRISSIDPRTGEVTTVTGIPGTSVVNGDGGRAASAAIGPPGAIDVGADGTLYLTDLASHRVRAVDARTGHLSTVAGTGRASRKASSSDRYPGGRCGTWPVASCSWHWQRCRYSS